MRYKYSDTSYKQLVDLYTLASAFTYLRIVTMSALRYLTIVVVIAVLIQPVVRGRYRVITVRHDQCINDDEDYSTYGSGSDYDSLNYCIDDNNSSYYSLHQALTNLTSNVLINITTDVVLSSIVPLVDLANITITGHNNPTVNCNNSGVLQFTSCNSIIIDGIIWNRCGYNSDNSLANAALEFANSSTISIQKCSFQHSKGQIFVLSGISGVLNIKNCRFVYNTAEYEDHGSIIHHSSNNSSTLTIVNCYFEGNKKAGSLVYISSSTDYHQYLYLENSTFINNKNILFHMSNVTLKLRGNLIFNRNAKNFKCINSDIIFDDNTVIHYNNTATILLLKFSSSVIFTRNSIVSFKKSGGYSNSVAIHIRRNSSVIFKENSSVTFSTISNTDKFMDRAINLRYHSSVIFEDNCVVTFDNNKCDGCYDKAGGAVYLYNSSMIVKGNSKVTFVNNSCLIGGAIFLQAYSKVIITENCTVAFNNNVASSSGGAIYLKDHSEVTFKENSTVIFSKNGADGNGGAISLHHSSIIFKETCTMIFDSNKASKGGAVYSTAHSTITFGGYSRVTFKNNEALYDAGAIYNDRVIYDDGDSNMIFGDSTEVLFTNNRANNDGGAVFIDNSNITFKEDSTTTFYNNTAKTQGGALCLLGKYYVQFIKGQVNFSTNTADIGGAILGKLQYEIGFTYMDEFYSTLKIVPMYFNINSGSIHFYNNSSANTYGDSVFFSISESSYYKYLLGISKSDIQQRGLTKSFLTIPYKLVLQHPTIFCDEFNNDTNCTSYQVNNIMLGQEVIISGCVYDYFDNPVTIATKFTVERTMFHESYDAVTFVESTYETCLSTLGIQINVNIIGNSDINSSFIYSVILTSSPLSHDWRPISLNLSIQLSPCHLGFQYSHDSQQCECYGEENNIVVCSGSISIIKRGYWFGTVNEKLTVAICPINYCDFSCCETNNGYHQLLPERENQCSSHRTGIACGNCEEGYILSYSADCVSVNKCTVGWTILVVILTVLYWMTIVVAVFVMMHYKLPIGYLYAITYYYSMIDVLLSQDLYFFSSLHIAVIITSSVFKVSPQFLGQFCLAKGLSGIDIQFIHYIHPLAISGILIMISLLAKCSRRLSAFISRGIIHVICCLLLLSYTSMASTSLLLIRSLSFHNIDKVFTYLSPDIEYLHGRHLVYFTVSVLCTIIIVIGLPLLLLLELFLNHKINFTRIKPLLDQFQGCYKDQYRWFAAYYMVCRMVLVTISIYSSNFLTTQCLLIFTNIIITLVHFTIQSYSKEILNVFDVFVLLLMIFIAQLPIFQYFSSITIVTMAFTAIVLPLLTFFIMGLIIHKAAIRQLLITCTSLNNANVNSEIPVKEFDVTNDKGLISNDMSHET